MNTKELAVNLFMSFICILMLSLCCYKLSRDVVKLSKRVDAIEQCIAGGNIDNPACPKLDTN